MKHPEYYLGLSVLLVGLSVLFSVCADVREAHEETTEGAQLFKEETCEGGWLE